MKRRTLNLLLCLILMLALIPTAAAAVREPELEADGGGSITGTGDENGTLYLASYDPLTGRFLGVRHSGDTVAGEDAVVKAIQADENSAPLSDTRSLLLIGRDYDRVVVTSSAAGAVTLKDMNILGDLVVCAGVDVTLDGTNVTGELMAGEPGTPGTLMESGGRPSIIIKNASSVGSIRISQTESGGLRVRTEEGCRVEWVYVDDGQGAISLEGSFNQIVVDTDTPVSLSGATVSGLTLKAEEASVALEEDTSVTAVLIQESARGAVVNVGEDARIARVDALAENAGITGAGEVKLAEVRGSGAKVDTVGTYLLVDANVENVTVNAQAVETGEEQQGYIISADNGAEKTETPPEPEHTIHEWGEGVITRLSTQEEDGEAVYVCTRCGEKHTEIIPRAPFTVALKDGTRLPFATLEEALAEAEKTAYREPEGGEWQYHPTIEVRGAVTLDTLDLPAGYILEIYGTLTIREGLHLAWNAETENGNWIYARLLLMPPLGVLNYREESWGFDNSCAVQLIAPANSGGENEPYKALFVGPDEAGGFYYFTMDLDVRVNRSCFVHDFHMGISDAEPHGLTVVSGAELDLRYGTLCTAVQVEEGAVLRLQDVGFREGAVLETAGMTCLSGWLDCPDGSVIRIGETGSLFLQVWGKDDEGNPVRQDSGIMLAPGSLLENSGRLVLECDEASEDQEEQGFWQAWLRIYGGTAVNKAAGQILNCGAIELRTGGSLENEGTLQNYRTFSADPGENRIVTREGEDPRTEETAAVCAFTSTGTLVNEWDADMDLSGSSVTLGGSVTNRGHMRISEAQVLERILLLKKAYGEPEENVPVWGMGDQDEGGFFHWVINVEERGVCGHFASTVTVTGTLMNEGSMDLGSTSLTVEEAAVLTNQDWFSIWKQADDPDDVFPFADPSVLIKGSFLNDGAEDSEEEEGFRGNYNQTGGRLRIADKGQLENRSEVRLSSGCALTNEGKLTNLDEFRLQAGEDRKITYGGDDPYTVTEETAAACTFTNAGLLLNGDDAQLWLSGAAVSLGGSVINNGDFILEEAPLYVHTLQAERVQGVPGEEEDHRGFWEENDEPYYWKITSDEYTQGEEFPSSAALTGSMLNRRNLVLDCASLTVEEGATLENEYRMEVNPSQDEQRSSAFTVAEGGKFLNGAVTGVGEEGGDGGSEAYCRQAGGVLTNNGSLVNNGRLELEDTDYVQGETGELVTYNSRGLDITSGSITVPHGGRFLNEGYLQITDRYGADYRPCDLSRFADFFITWTEEQDESHWCRYNAEVYDLEGFQAAEAEQRARASAWERGDIPFDTRYDEMTIRGDITLEQDQTLDAFRTYWLRERPVKRWMRWNDELEEDEILEQYEPGAWSRTDWEPVTFTVPDGVTLTVPRHCNLHADPGTLNIEAGGTLEIQPCEWLWENEEEGWGYWEDRGYVTIWPHGSLTNSGTITLDYIGDLRDEAQENVRGLLEIMYEETEYWDEEEDRPEYTGAIARGEEAVLTGVPEGVLYTAQVYTLPGFESAVGNTEPVFRRIYIRNDSTVSFPEDLIVNADLNIDPGSGLIVEYGAALTVNGHMWNGGDVTVWGDLILNRSLDNQQNMDVGSFDAEEPGRLYLNGYGENRDGGRMTVYPSGSVILGEDSSFRNRTEDRVPVVLTGPVNELEGVETDISALPMDRDYLNCLFTGDLTLMGDPDRDVGCGFDECEFLGNVTVQWTEGNGGIYVGFRDNAVFAEGKKVLITGDGDAARIDYDAVFAPMVDIDGAAGLTVESQGLSVSVSFRNPGWQKLNPGSFTLNGVSAEIPAEELDRSWGSCQLRYEKNDGSLFTVFQADGDDSLWTLSGSLADFDELRLMQGDLDVSGVTDARNISIYNGFSPIRAALGSNSARAVFPEPEADEPICRMDLTASAGAEITVENSWIRWVGDGYESSQLTVNGEWITPHIFGTRTDSDDPGVFIGTSDENAQYALTVGGQAVEYDPEIIPEDNKTHLWRKDGGQWFTAGPNHRDPGVSLSIRLPAENGSVTVTVQDVPVKPEWEEPEPAA